MTGIEKIKLTKTCIYFMLGGIKINLIAKASIEEKVVCKMNFTGTIPEKINGTKWRNRVSA